MYVNLCVTGDSPSTVVLLTNHIRRDTKCTHKKNELVYRSNRDSEMKSFKFSHEIYYFLNVATCTEPCLFIPCTSKCTTAVSQAHTGDQKSITQSRSYNLCLKISSRRGACKTFQRVTFILVYCYVHPRHTAIIVSQCTSPHQQASAHRIMKPQNPAYVTRFPNGWNRRRNIGS